MNDKLHVSQLRCEHLVNPLGIDVPQPRLSWILETAERAQRQTAYQILVASSAEHLADTRATSIWERWDGWTHDKGFQDPSMNSFNHYAYGAIGAWMYAVVGGIDLDPEQPGYKHIIMRPRPGGDLTSATAELRSIYGSIRSAWTLENRTFDWQIAIPANTSATMYVPTAESATVRESGGPAAQALGVMFLRREADAAVYEIAAGAYHFTAN